MPGSLLSKPFPSKEEWVTILETFAPEAIAHKLLLSHVPFVFRDEPLKFALFRRTIADEFSVAPTNVFIVGSAMAGRSLKGQNLHKEFDTSSDIDTLIVSESLFTSFVMKSLEWVQKITEPSRDKKGNKQTPDLGDQTWNVGLLAMHACRGIWRPDSLDKKAAARNEFFDRFSNVSLKTLGLQLSEDTVAKVSGRIARSFDDAVTDLTRSLARLRNELRQDTADGGAIPEPVLVQGES